MRWRELERWVLPVEGHAKSEDLHRGANKNREYKGMFEIMIRKEMKMYAKYTHIKS